MLRKTLVHLCTPSEIEDALRNLGLPVTVSPRLCIGIPFCF